MSKKEIKIIKNDNYSYTFKNENGAYQIREFRILKELNLKGCSDACPFYNDSDCNQNADGVPCYTESTFEIEYYLTKINKKIFNRKQNETIRLDKEFGYELFYGIEKIYDTVNYVKPDTSKKQSKRSIGYINALYEAGKRGIDLICELHSPKLK